MLRSKRHDLRDLRRLPDQNEEAKKGRTPEFLYFRILGCVPFLPFVAIFPFYFWGLSGAPPGTAPLRARKSLEPSGNVKFLPTALLVPSFA